MAQHITITDDQKDQRIDNFLIAHWHRRCPKSRIYRAIRSGEVRINKGRVKQTYRLKVGDVVRIPPIQTTAPMPKEGLQGKLDLDAIRLFEDGHILIVDKPSGLPVHAGSGYSFGVVDCLRDHYPKSAFLDLVHRLDRGTSGVLVLAKKKTALRALQAQWRDLKVHKIYWALLAGSMEKDKVISVDAPLKAVKAQGYHKVYVHQDGKPSHTTVKVLESSDACSWVEAKPETGRMHQIRVHSLHIGHPILGDETYHKAHKDFDRLCLHAREIAFEHPVSGEKIVVCSPFPNDLKLLFSKLKMGS